MLKTDLPPRIQKMVLVEWVHSENLISKSGIENWSANEVDHPRFDEASALGPIHGVPAHIIYTE